MTEVDIVNNKKLCVGFMGLPNAGKSTMINLLTKQKTSIVTTKPQTTRTVIVGTVKHKDLNITLLDAPGMFKPMRALEKVIVKNAVLALREADVLLWILDSQSTNMQKYKDLIQIANSANKPVICAINKIDIQKEPHILSGFVAQLQQNVNFNSMFYISALQGIGQDKILDHLLSIPINQHSATFKPTEPSFYTCELTREHLFNALYQELPYSVTVAIESWVETDRTIKINQVIYISNKKHKPILISKNGALLKKVGIAVRTELSAVFNKKISLFLHVAIKENWQSSNMANQLVNEAKSLI